VKGNDGAAAPMAIRKKGDSTMTMQNFSKTVIPSFAALAGSYCAASQQLMPRTFLPTVISRRGTQSKRHRPMAVGVLR
jgi:hypothetical protein